MTFKVCIDKLRWVVTLQAFDEAFGQIWVVSSFDPDKPFIGTILFYKGAVAVSESLRRGLAIARAG